MCDNSRSRKKCCYAADERKRKTKHGQRNKFVGRTVQSERERTDQAIYIENLPGRQKPGSVPDEICGIRTLRELCWVILDAFDFDHDHLYAFCMDNRMYGRHAYQACPRYDEPSVDITLDELALHKGQKFSLHYDFGDDWMFKITVFKISEVKEPIESRIIKTKGFIEQY